MAIFIYKITCKNIVRSNLVISGENMSDHLPLSIVLNFSDTNIIHSSKPTAATLG